MKPAQEIEIKFAAPPELLPRLQHQLPAKAIRTAKPKSLVSVYFDTDKLKLHKHGLTLRVRRDGEQRLQTVKVENGQALTARGEWERAIQSDQPDFKAVQGTPAERILRKKKIRGTIKPIFETRVTRTTCPVKIGRSLIEVAFDLGEIDTGHASAPLSEVEFELKRGEPADLFQFAKTIAHKAPLELALVSKAERGYRLVAGEESAPNKAAAVALTPDMSSAEAFQAIARACLRQLTDNVPVLRRGDPEGLHQARVAVRRLRAAISLFVELLHDDGTQAIKDELKWVMGEFGPAREMDVLTKSLATASDVQFRSHGSPKELEALGMELEGKRRRAFQRAQAAVEATRFRMLLVDLVAWIDAGDWLTTDGPTARVERARPIIEFAAEQLERRWKKILKRGRKLRELDPQRRHKLRIQVKKTRYAAEFFAGAFSSRKARRRGKTFLRTIEPLQDCLGDLNDIVVDRQLSAKLAARQKRKQRGEQIARRAFAAGEFAGQEEARIDALLTAAEKSYADLACAKPFWSGVI
jgi:triphosphatase